jgi:hypothetical protein
MYNYKPQPYPGRAILFRAADVAEDARPSYTAAQELVQGGLEICDVPGEHHTIALEPNIEVLAKQLNLYIHVALESITEKGLAKRSTIAEFRDQAETGV